jgi:hypothetical protein
VEEMNMLYPYDIGFISRIVEVKMRKQLEEKIYAQGYPDAKEAPIVTLEDFFEGNIDEGSIGCNLFVHPGLETFYDVLLNIRNMDNVQDVFVEIMELEDDEEYWAFSERVYIFTNEEKSLVKEWVNVLEPSEVDEGYAFGKPPIAPKSLPGYKVYSIWWD